MTETKTETMSMIISLLQKILSRLNESYFRGNSHLAEPIDSQCEARFGKSWNEVKAQMMLAMSNIMFAGTDTINLGIAVKGIGLSGGTSNWMTNKYLGVLYLFEARKLSARSLMNSFAYNDAVKDIESGHRLEFPGETKPLYWNLLHIAFLVMPEEVEKVLASHGL